VRCAKRNSSAAAGSVQTLAVDRRPIAWLVSSIFTIAPFVMSGVACAQSLPGMRSHISIAEWAAQGGIAEADAPDKAQLAAQVRADERKRLAQIDTPEGQAKLAAQARRDEDARLASDARIAGEAEELKRAQEREAQRLADEAKRAKAALAAQAQREAQAAKALEVAKAEAARESEAHATPPVKRAAAASASDTSGLVVFTRVPVAAPAYSGNPADAPPPRAGTLNLGAPPPRPPDPLPATLAAQALHAVESPRTYRRPSDADGTGPEPVADTTDSHSKRRAAKPAPEKGAPGQFAQWLETETDTFNDGPTPSSPALKRIIWQAVRRANEISPEVRQAYADYKAAGADVDEAKGQRWPQVDIGSQSPSANFGPGGGNGGNNSGNPLSVNVTTNVFDWGRTRSTIGSREHFSEAANLKYQSVLGDNAYSVVATLIELGKQRNIVDLSQQFVTRMAALVKMLSEIVAVDRGRGSELTQAKTRLLQAQASRDTAEAKVRDAELTLRKLVGDEPVPIPRTREWSLEPGNLPQLLSLASTHPNLRQAQEEAKAADLNADAVRAAAKPQVNWVVSAGLAKDALGRRQPWQTMLTLNWGAFRGGSAKAAAEAARQRAAASWQRMELQQRDLEYAIRGADQDAHTLLQRADLYEGLGIETDRVRKAFFEQWYHLGRRTLLDVLTAENEHYGNRVAEVNNRFDGYLSIMKEHYAAGGLVPWLQGEPDSKR
jgi:outer membrane protein, adhesin transport system